MKKNNIISLITIIMAFSLCLNSCELLDTEPVGQDEYSDSTAVEYLPNSVVDIDGNVYDAVRIGSQVWMAENLKTTRFANGNSIQLVLNGYINHTQAYRYYPRGNESLVEKFGYLYNWPAAMSNEYSSAQNPSGVQGVCPDGWHMPSDPEWEQLIEYVGRQSRFVCDNNSSNIGKALAAQSDWLSNWLTSDPCSIGNNLSTNNSTGFSALPAGSFGYEKDDDFREYAYFWSSTSNTNVNEAASAYFMKYYDECLYQYCFGKGYGFSVRCVKNE